MAFKPCLRPPYTLLPKCQTQKVPRKDTLNKIRRWSTPDPLRPTGRPLPYTTARIRNCCLVDAIDCVATPPVLPGERSPPRERLPRSLQPRAPCQGSHPPEAVARSRAGPRCVAHAARVTIATGECFGGGGGSYAGHAIAHAEGCGSQECRGGAPSARGARQRRVLERCGGGRPG